MNSLAVETGKVSKFSRVDAYLMRRMGFGGVTNLLLTQLTLLSSSYRKNKKYHYNAQIFP